MCSTNSAQGRSSPSTQARECPVCGGVGLRPVTVRGVPPLLECGDCDLRYRRDIPGEVSDSKLGEAELLRLGESRNTLYQAGLRAFESSRQIGAILDVGSGGGQFARGARASGWQVTSLEGNDYLCRMSSSLGTPFVVRGTAVTLPFGPERFDVVTMWDMLDCLEHPMPALREALRVLRPGGLLHVRVRNGPVHVALRRSRLVPAETSVFHTLLLSRASLATALGRAGFEDSTISIAPLTTGNPYGEDARAKEGLIRAIKASWQATAALFSVLTGTRVLLAPSIQAVGIRPQA